MYIYASSSIPTIGAERVASILMSLVFHGMLPEADALLGKVLRHKDELLSRLLRTGVNPLVRDCTARLSCWNPMGLLQSEPRLEKFSNQD